MVSSAPHAAFRDNHQGRHKRAAFVNTIDVRLLLIRLLADDSHPVHQSKDELTLANVCIVFESVWICVRSIDVCPRWLIVICQVCCCCCISAAYHIAHIRRSLKDRSEKRNASWYYSQRWSMNLPAIRAQPPPDSLKLPSGFYNEGCALFNDLLWR